VKNSDRTILLALGFELALGWIGLLIAWLTGLSLGSQFILDWPGMFQGLAATMPMLGLLGLLIRSRWSPLVELRQQVDNLLGNLFRQSTLWEMALVSFAAGVGEELLFRGVLQQLLQQWIDPTMALLLVGLLFGLAHAMSATYFVLATLAGIYLGWLALACGNLVPPMIAHGLYDFIAMWCLREARNEGGEDLEASE
jgi:membrane protease YdiL (CAAX protease family)